MNVESRLERLVFFFSFGLTRGQCGSVLYSVEADLLVTCIINWLQPRKCSFNLGLKGLSFTFFC